MELKETPLAPEHERLGALLGPFGGWRMPIQYEGILAEHRWCREKAALFDICHMGELGFRGDVAASGLDEVFTFPVASLPVGRARYGFLLNEEGGIVDDLVVLRTAADEALVVTNATRTERDLAVIASRLAPGAELRDLSASTGKLDLQGPLSRDVLVAHFGSHLADLPYFGFREVEVQGAPAIVSRTGYTGELGYELYLPAQRVVEAWRLLLADERVRPAGLGARDLLRLEVGYPLYGSELDEETTPLEAGLGRFVDLGRPFVGREALLRRRGRPGRVRVALRADSRRSPRPGYEVLRDSERVGTVTSGAFSPTLGCGIGLGYVSPEASAVGTAVTIVHGNVRIEAEIVDLPFYPGGSARR